MKWTLRLLLIFTLVSHMLAAQGIPEPVSTNTGRQNAAGSALSILKSAGEDLEMARNLTNVGSSAGTERCVKLLKDASTKLESAAKVGNHYQKQEIGLILQQIEKIRFTMLQSDSTQARKAIDKIFNDVNNLGSAVTRLSDAVVTGRKEVEAIFPSRNDIQLLNITMQTVDESVSASKRRITTYYIILSADEDKYLSWFHNSTNTYDAPFIVTIIKKDRVGFSDTFTGYRKVISKTDDVNQIVFGDWIVEGVQYNPPASQNPQKEFFIVDPLGKTVKIALDFGAAGRFELSTDQLKKDYSSQQKSLSLDFSSALIPR